MEVEEEEDDRERQGNDELQPLPGPLEVLELPRPLDADARGQLDLRGHHPTGLFHVVGDRPAGEAHLRVIPGFKDLRK